MTYMQEFTKFLIYCKGIEDSSPKQSLSTYIPLPCPGMGRQPEQNTHVSEACNKECLRDLQVSSDVNQMHTTPQSSTTIDPGEYSLQETEQSCAFTQRFALSMALIVMKSLGSNTARPRWKYKLCFFTLKLYLLQFFLRIACYLLREVGHTDRYSYEQDFVRAPSCAFPCPHDDGYFLSIFILHCAILLC